MKSVEYMLVLAISLIIGLSILLPYSGLIETFIVSGDDYVVVLYKDDDSVLVLYRNSSVEEVVDKCLKLLRS